jgi:hypothetical protein
VVSRSGRIFRAKRMKRASFIPVYLYSELATIGVSMHCSAAALEEANVGF